MGCDASKPNRSDIPTIGCHQTFEVVCQGGGPGTPSSIVVYDGQQSRWMEVVIDAHLQMKAELAALNFQEWCKEGVARLVGPLGAQDQRTIMTLKIGRATFEEVGAIEDDTGSNNGWPDFWSKQEFIDEIEWVCLRSLSVQSNIGGVGCVLGHAIHGASRVCQITQESPRELTGQGPQRLHYEHHADSRYGMAAYNGQIAGDEIEIDGELLSPRSCAARYGGGWALRSTNPSSIMHVDGTTIKTHYTNKRHCVGIEVADEVHPLPALCMGIAVGAFMHPLEVEKYATYWAWKRFQEPRRASSFDAVNGLPPVVETDERNVAYPAP